MVDDTGFVVRKAAEGARNTSRLASSGRRTRRLRPTELFCLWELGRVPATIGGHVTLVTIQFSRVSCPHATARHRRKNMFTRQDVGRAEPLPRSPALCGFLPFARLRRSVVFLAIATTAHRLADFL